MTILVTFKVWILFLVKGHTSNRYLSWFGVEQKYVFFINSIFFSVEYRRLALDLLCVHVFQCELS